MLISKLIIRHTSKQNKLIIVHTKSHHMTLHYCTAFAAILPTVNTAACLTEDVRAIFGAYG